MSIHLLNITIKYEQDVVAARQRARQLALHLGFDTQDQTKIATAVSEIARNAFSYAGGGKVEFAVEGKTSPQLLTTRISDAGPGIVDLPRILEGRYRSPTGMGLGIIGAKRLMDSFDVASSPGGTVVTLRKLLPPKAAPVGPDRVRQITSALAAQRPDDHFGAIRQQNQELLSTLEELRRRQDELSRLNRELEDTNRGVVALYAELDERADHLRRADEVKTRFLSNMTHEFRTPVNSIMALSGLLMDRVDGDLNPEQEKQVGFIRKAAHDLSELVNDLLDLAKVQAGKTVVRSAEFRAESLFGALRGMLRPLLVNQSLSLVFDEPREMPELITDESKVSQILRNFISNSLKFTERGEIRVATRHDADTDVVEFSVTDTGIGIAPGDLERIFEEFSQIESPVQRRVKGTGLGLPLTRRLAELLGGGVTVESTPGVGSRFILRIPRVYEGERSLAKADQPPPPEPGKLPVLAIEDRAEDRLVYERLLRGSQYQLITASSLREARAMVVKVNPRAILLDLLLGHEDSWRFLAELKASHATAATPIIIVTAVDDQPKAAALGADSYGIKPLDRQWLLGELQRLINTRTALIIDDDEVARYTLRQMLRRAGWDAVDASSGPDGLRLANPEFIGAVFLDLSMPGMNGLEVLEQLRQNPQTRELPVFVSSAATLTPDERSRIESLGGRILPKGLIGPAGIAEALVGLCAEAPAEGLAAERASEEGTC